MKKVMIAFGVFVATFSTLMLIVMMTGPFSNEIEAGDLEGKKISEDVGKRMAGEKKKEWTIGRDALTLTFTGDVLFEKSTIHTTEEHGYTYPFEHVEDAFLKDDYTFVNLETPVTARGEREEKLFTFRTDAEALDGMEEVGVDAYSLANNHTLDYGRVGLLDTLDEMEERGVPFLGAGRNKEEAYRGMTMKKKGETIHFLSFSRVLPTVDWYAGPERPGIASGYQVERMEALIEEAKRSSDYVMVQIHWGDERQTSFQPEEQSIAHRLVDAGADVIVGHHPHVLQGFEYYNDGFIAYSLGNFLFPDYVEKETAYTGYLQVEIEDGDIYPSFVPMIIENDQMVPVENEKRALERLEERSANIVFNQYRIERASVY